MKILIAYDSVNGATEECVKMLTRALVGEITTVKGVELKKLDISQYDTVLIGSPIRYGRATKPIYKFCKKRKDELLTKRIGLFVTCVDNVYLENYFKASFGMELVNHSDENVCFGGRIPFNPPKASDASMVKSIHKDLNKRGIKPPNISKKLVTHFAEAISGEQGGNVKK